jgi:hypothetical protein
MVGFGTVTASAMQERLAEASTNVNYPTATINAGDLLVLLGSVNCIGTPVTSLAGSGWTEPLNASRTSGTTQPALYVAYKKAAGGESGTLSVTHQANVSMWAMLHAPGVDPTTQLDVAAAILADNGASQNHTDVSLTTLTPGTLLVYAAALNSTTATSTPPSTPAGFTEFGDLSTGTRAATFAYLKWSGVGATGTVSNLWTSSTRSMGVLLAFRPSVAKSTGLLLPGFF